MTDIDALIDRLLKVAQQLDGSPPYDHVAMPLSIAELTLLSKGLGLLAAVRGAVK